MTFLIPLDGKPHSQQSVDLLQRVFDICNADVTLLHVLEEPQSFHYLSNATDSSSSGKKAKARMAMQALLDEVSGPLAGMGAKVDTLIESGSPAAVIKKVAASIRASVIISVRGKNPPKKVMRRGSITSELLRLPVEATSILARKPKTLSAKPIVSILLDGSTESHRLVCKVGPLIKHGVTLKVVATNPEDSPFLDRINGGKGDNLDYRLVLNELTEKGVPTELVKLDCSVFDWLASNGSIDLLLMARSREGVLNQNLLKTSAGEIYFNSSVSTGLYSDGLT
jgi:nucleotide-binding universal stress UspA family protein